MNNVRRIVVRASLGLAAAVLAAVAVAGVAAQSNPADFHDSADRPRTLSWG